MGFRTFFPSISPREVRVLNSRFRCLLLRQSRVFLTILLLLALGVVGAGATSTKTPVILGYTGILLTTGGSSQPLQVQSDYVINNPSGIIANATYRVGFRLVDADGHNVSTETFTQPFSTTLFPRQSTTGTVTASLTQEPITTGIAYHLAAQLYLQVGVRTYNPAGPVAKSPDYRFTVSPHTDSAGLSPWVNSLGVERSTALSTSPDGSSFQFRLQGVVGRFDAPLAPVTTDPYQLFFDAQLLGAKTGKIELSSPRSTASITIDSRSASQHPVAIPLDQLIEVKPTVQMDPTDHYTLSVQVAFAGPDGVEHAGETIELPDQRLLHFNGTLQIGNTLTTLTALQEDPQPLGTIDQVGENTSISIPAGGGYLNADPRYTFGTGSDLQVLLHTDGTATTSDSLSLLLPDGGENGMVQGVRFSRSNLRLDDAGFHATCSVRLPAGWGIAVAPNQRRQMSLYPLGEILLDETFNPIGSITLNPALFDQTFLFATHSQLPLQFKCSSIVWDVATATFTLQTADTRHVRIDETTQLAGLPLTAQTLAAKDRPSNDGYLLNPDSGAGQQIVITADAEGRGILSSAQISLPASTYVAHFPDHTTVQWTEEGTLQIRDGRIDTAQSQLPGALPVGIDGMSGAPTLPPPAAADVYQFTSDTASWRFTPDGGLWSEGTVDNGAMRWGARDANTFAQSVASFTRADLLIPGIALRNEFASVERLDNRPGHLLYSGQGMPGNLDYSERPGTTAYATGAADYAGVNFRVFADGDVTATTLLGDAVLGPYSLRNISKYYVRHGGISGVHAGVKSEVAQLGSNLSMYGFPLRLEDYQISYLDNVVIDSRASGTIQVPGVRGNPGFEQSFVRLTFDPKGYPKHLTLPDPNNDDHLLAYWNVRLLPAAAEFMAAQGDPNPRALVFGGDVAVPGVLKNPVHGNLGFFSTGRMVSESDRILGVNSRIKAPKHIALHGPGSLLVDSKTPFYVVPVTDVYFNNPEAPGAPDKGFAAFAGTIKVPFFKALEAHVLARANGQDTLIRAGWVENNQTFFTKTNFDNSNRGFDPAAPDFDKYANSNESPNFEYYDPDGDAAHQQRNPYNPLARQSWLGFVNFAMPVRWDPALHRFISSTPESREFLVLKSQRVIKQLTPSGAEIKFGLQFKGLPRLNLAAMLIDEKELTQDVIGFIPHGSDLVNGLAAFNALLSNDQSGSGTESDKLILQGLDAILDPLFEHLFDPGQPLENALSASDVASALGDPNNHFATDLQQQLTQIAGDLNQANSISHQIQDALHSVNDGLSVADTILKKDAKGQRGAFITDTLNLAGSISMSDGDLNQVSSAINQAVNGELAPTLDEIQEAVSEVHSLSTSAEKVVTQLHTLTQGALDAVNEVKSGKGLPDLIVKEMVDSLSKANDPTHRYVAEIGKEALKAKLKAITRQAILQSGFITEVQTTIRNLLSPVRDEYKGAFDQIFGVMNDLVRSAVESLSDEVVDHLNEDVGRINRGLEAVSKTFELSRTDGSAYIHGDVLQSAHIDSTFSLHVPDTVVLKGSIDFLRQQADQPVPPCSFGLADGQMQITVTAGGSASIGAGPPIQASLRGQYTLNAQGKPLAVSGGFSAQGDVHFDLLALKNAEFNFQFGAQDNYLEAAGAGSIYIFDVEVKVFLGRTCNLALLHSIDPQLDELLQKLGVDPTKQGKTLTGYYFRGDGGVSLNRLLDIPDAVIQLSAKGGQGTFLFLTDDLKYIIPGQHWRFGLDVGLLGMHVGSELKALGGLNAVSLVQPDDGVEFAKSLLTLKQGLLGGVIRGDINVTAEVKLGPLDEGVTKHFPFTAKGSYTPPPLAPPPGFIFVKDLDLDP